MVVVDERGQDITQRRPFPTVYGLGSRKAELILQAVLQWTRIHHQAQYSTKSFEYNSERKQFLPYISPWTHKKSKSYLWTYHGYHHRCSQQQRNY